MEDHFALFCEKSMKDFCKKIDSLPASKSKKYASGTPKAEELRFIDENRIDNQLENER